jgi:secreted trypsin-like serine protease
MSILGRFLFISLFALISVSIQARSIISGQLAKVGEFPFIAAIYTKGETPLDGFYCGASLIQPDLLVTAAHCVEGVPANALSVVVGVHDIGLAESAYTPYSAAKIFMHSDYDSFSLGNDIALIRLTESAESNPIEIIDDTHYQGLTTDTEMTVAGWGNMTLEEGNGSNYPRLLQKAIVDFIDQQTCQSLKVSSPYSQLDNFALCAAREGIELGSGDSGGPLIYQHNERYYLTGIVSWNLGYASASEPGIYMSVHQYIEWINKAIEDGSI